MATTKALELAQFGTNLVVDGATGVATQSSLTLSGTTSSTSTTTGSLVTLGGAGIAENLYVGGNTVISGNVDAVNTTLSGDIGAVNATLSGDVGAVNATLSGNLGAVNATLSGYLRGPASFVIDPAAYGDDTGTVVIAGNLQVDGLTTTINSTTLTVDDKNIVLASGAVDSAAANGAGITVAGASAQLTYDSIQDRWNMNKGLELLSSPLVVGTGSTDVGRVENSAGVFSITAYTGRQIAFGNDSNGEHVRIDADGKIGIGIQVPTSTVDIRGPNGAVQSRGQLYLANTDVAAIDQGSQISLGGTYSGTGDTYFASVAGRKENNTVNNFEGYLQFATRQTSGNIERMRITSSGNVGIGITPRARLDIFQTSNRTSKTGTTRGVLHLQDGDTPASNEITAITFESNSNNASAIIGQSLTNNGSELFFGTSNGYVSGVTNTAMTINPSGNVGIGTDTPSTRLDVEYTAGGTIAKFFDTGSNGGAQYNSAAVVGISRVGNGTVSLAGPLFQVGNDTSSSTAYNIDEPIFTVTNANVGIGISSPVAPLHTQFSNNDGGVGGHLIKNTNTGTTSNFASLSTQAVNGTIQGTFGSAHYSTWGNAVVFAGSQSAHPFKILTGNAVRATFDTSGRIEIGNNIPMWSGSYGGALLLKGNNATADRYAQLTIVDSTGSIVNQGLIVDNNGNVGIGTTAPAVDLDVRSNSVSNPAFISTGNSDGSEFVTLYGGTSVDQKSAIWWDSGQSELKFGTATSKIGASESIKMTIKSTGNVGIGTGSPATKLEISTTTEGLITSGANRQGSVIRLTHDINHEAGYGGGDFLGGIEFESGDGSAGSGVRAAIRAEATDPYNTHSLKFYTATANSTSIAARMTIDSIGNVGIGTATPGRQLEIFKAGSAGAYRLKVKGDTGYTGIEIENTSSSNTNILFRNPSYTQELYMDAAGKFHVFNNNLHRFTVDQTGNVGIGTSAPSVGLVVEKTSDYTFPNLPFNGGFVDTTAMAGGVGGGIYFGGRYITASSATTGFAAISGVKENAISANTAGALVFGVRDASGGVNIERMRIDSAGNLILTGGTITALAIYNSFGGSPNMYIRPDGLIMRAGSSLRYKNTVIDATHGLAELLTLRPVTYKSNSEGDLIYGGLIAEEVYAAGLPEFVQYDQDGEPDGLSYGNMVSLCIKAIQEQQAMITSLTARLESLEGAN